MRKRQKNYWDMSKEELADATREFDSELARDDFRPLGPEKQAIWQRLQQQKGKKRLASACHWVIRSKSDLRELRQKVEQAALALQQRMKNIMNASGLKLIQDLNLGEFGYNPCRPGQSMNLVEQINQSATLLVACAAVERLMRKHPSRQGYVISSPTGPGYDIWAADASVVAEVFAATSPRSNRKLKNDLEAVRKDKEPFRHHPPEHRYVFFVARAQEGFRSLPFQGPEDDPDLKEKVWHLSEPGRPRVTVVPLSEQEVFGLKHLAKRSVTKSDTNSGVNGNF